MARFVILTLGLLAYFTFALGLAAPSISHRRDQVVFGSGKIHIRPATVHDLDDITTINIDAFSPGPIYHYLIPEFERYRDYWWRCTRKEAARQFAELTENNFVNVIAVPINDHDGHTSGDRNERVVSMGSWAVLEPSDEDNIHVQEAPFASLLKRAGCSDHLGMNLTRAEDYSRQFSAGADPYIDDYPQKQFYLALLATHPDWDGLGFGAAQVGWGLALAAKMNLTTTLIGTEAGWPLYDQLGFDSVANITIKTLDDSDDIWFEYMRYNV